MNSHNGFSTDNSTINIWSWLLLLVVVFLFTQTISNLRQFDKLKQLNLQTQQSSRFSHFARRKSEVIIHVQSLRGMPIQTLWASALAGWQEDSLKLHTEMCTSINTNYSYINNN